MSSRCASKAPRNVINALHLEVAHDKYLLMSLPLADH